MEQRLEQEIEAKIKEMEAESYVFPRRMQKSDYVFTALVIIICLAGLIWGAFLG